MPDIQIQPGKRLELQRRAQELTDKFADDGNNIRSKFNNRLEDGIINPANSNISTATTVGAVGTVIVWLLEDYLPGRVGGDASVINVEGPNADGGVVYTVDTNAPLESQARFRSILEAGTGVTSLWTDDITVDSIETIKMRPGRDTYRYKITVK